MQTTTENKFALFEGIQRARTAAALMFDKGKRAGKKMEELSVEIEPLTKQLMGSIKKAAEDDLAQVFMAYSMFRAHIDSHNLVIRQIQTKISDIRNQQMLIETALIQTMKEKGVETLSIGDYSATLVEQDGKLSLNLR